jgi:O-antigen/teichoic acid export membrane protein
MKRPREEQVASGQADSGWARLWARDASVIASSQALVILVTSVLTILVARELGPRDFGIFASFLGLSQALGFITDMGVTTWLIRELSALLDEESEVEGYSTRRRAAGSLLSTSSAFAGSVTVVAAAGSFGIALLVGSTSELAIAVAALMAYAGLLNIAASIEATFRARRTLGKFVLANVVEKGLLVCLVGAMLLAEGGIVAIAVCYVAAGLARVVFVGVMVFGRIVSFVRPTFRELRDVVLQALPFGLNATVITAVTRLDTFLVSLSSLRVASFYAIGDRFVTGIAFIPTAASTTLYPLLARRSDGARITAMAACVMGVIGLVLGGLLILAAPRLVPALFGQPYLDAVPGVQVMLASSPLMFASAVLMTGLYSAGRERQVLAVMAPVSLAGTGLVLGGLALFGLVGAAAGFVGRQLMFCVGLVALAIIHRHASAGDRAALGERNQLARSDATAAGSARGRL